MTDSEFDLGKRLKSLRTRSGMTLRQLARESGVAFGTIQKIEQNITSPTVGILMKIARGLNVRMTALLEEEPEARTIQFIEKAKRIDVRDRQHDIEIQYIAQNLVNPELFGFCLTVGSGEGSGPEPLFHGGEEIVIGLEGKIAFIVGEEEYTIGPGDCLHFKSGTPHRWMNKGRTRTSFYLISSESYLPPAPPNQV
jgi:transcriptional regulator with XRE-family HTH domain